MTGRRGFVAAVVVYVTGGPAERPGDEAQHESWLVLCVRILPPVTAALILRSVLDWGDGLVDWLKTLVLVLPIGVIWAAVLWLLRWPARKRSSSPG